MPHGFDRWMYAGGRPNRLARFLNGIWRRLASAGVTPGLLSTLEVRGRRSGRMRSFPVVVADHDGERYLVAMLGESSNWAKNVRAAGGAAVLIHRGREPVHLEEVDPAERAAVLRRYVEVAPGGRAHIPVEPGEELAAFEQVAPRYPVFRIEQRPGSDTRATTNPAS